MIGILANISCQHEIAVNIATDEEAMAVICTFLSNTDSPTVIQCVRLLDTLLRSLKSEQLISLTTSATVWRDIGFILKNSLNGIYYNQYFTCKAFHYIIFYVSVQEELLCSSAKLLEGLVSHLDMDSSNLSHVPHDGKLQ